MIPTASKAAARAEAARILALFTAAGAEIVEADILQPADVLLDLYGEDIRARAYVTNDPLRGEMMLRPDFTVPLVQMHMAAGAGPGRYAYAGEVFRRQEVSAGPAEFIQVGFELFTEQAEADADAEVYATITAALGDLNVQAAMGDIGILVSAVRALDTSDARKAALLRHVWRPRRFRLLLDRFGGRQPLPAPRADVLADAPPAFGLRSMDEVAARLDAMREDAATPPIPPAQMALFDEILAVAAPAPQALRELRDIASRYAGIAPAVARLSLRMEALTARGIDLAEVAFETTFGRTALEYYDGFVFGLYAAGRHFPPVASGGRYDALTRVLGQGRAVPAVGGVIRPEIVVGLKGA
ncbi:ATP phosphoribosyltransferase regulatory subunit [Ketogulonicigenium vulgare]|uniref:Histidyl-tRNA synthetase,-like protein protein, putative n=1 Tax=Ketogulonicigenium vulgare (strain WSH-001) TaxID=759362 RepID=F9YAL5_KETVW|nr:ATP phosphoribosyltransferase regulatory subunit [Ketogulonicigenium vulgare]ADO43252.1 ATP phosphoribosyltransferase regulatory subunit [Ketogulonicigenium vulgare Y25]AEM41546.1 Histidyl-tRNA synthetase,-like protein protein, putative [Ketogulonicigenium vulgare WSH-001]ALJ81667.1 ATP phosphoribosyltransferase regulatory subunit [Ketogulonicigenium vulgare]ANW34336.1 ATP phosphoribosyltransferase regulatory subunit [Ketogulonicigenium vulgare]AOZ55288.1 ATP phosphoribosyltransferase regul